MEDLSYSFPSPHFYLGGFEFSVIEAWFILFEMYMPQKWME